MRFTNSPALNLHSLEEAIKDFSKAAQMEPTRSMASVFLSRGKCYLLLPKQDIAAALADFDKSITLDPTIPAAFYNRGLVHENMGRHARAADDYTRCVELAEQLGGFDWHGHHALSNLYMAQGNFKKALKHIQVCALAYPDESRFQSRTAWCLWQIEKMNPLKGTYFIPFLFGERGGGGGEEGRLMPYHSVTFNNR